MKTIKWGIIGTGKIAATFANTLGQMEYTEIAAVASRSEKKAREFADKFHIQKAYGSYEELARDPEIDVIYIGTPHTEHKPNAELCMKNGKAVLCEKPFALNATEAKYLMDLAKEHNVFLMEAMWTKFLPVTKKVKEWITSGRIGTIQKIETSFGFAAPYDETNRLYNFDLAGGALLDVGVYTITYIIYLLDKLPIQVLSTGAFLKSGIDGQNCILLKFDNNVLATASSAINANIGEDAVIFGDQGRIVVPGFWSANKAYLYDQDGKEVEVFEEKNRITGYEHEAYEVNDCIRNGRKESSINPLRNTLDIIQVMDGIRNQWGLKYKQEL
jgi:dihydrodiol dehydrogenase / D-xylose 1-dehydrogenase (NADP)